MAQIEIQSLQAKVNALGEVIKQYNVDFEKLPRKGIELARLERKRQSCQKLYTMLEEEYQRARVAEESQFGNAEIVDRAIPQISPIGISKSLLLIMAALGGFSIGLGYVLLRRYLDRTVRTFDDIEQRAGLSVLAAIPTITVDDELGKIRMDDNVRAKLQRIKAQMITHLEPLSIVSESYKVLRTNIQFAGLDKPIKTILVTSSIAGEGKTTVASNLAITMAQAGNRTLIVGAYSASDAPFGVRCTSGARYHQLPRRYGKLGTDCPEIWHRSVSGDYLRCCAAQSFRAVELPEAEGFHCSAEGQSGCDSVRQSAVGSGD